METAKFTIAIAGTDQGIANGVADKLASGNIRLVLCDDNNLDEITSMGKQIKENNRAADIKISDCMKSAMDEADIILLAMPHKRQRAVADLIREAAMHKIVISLSMPKMPSFEAVLQNMNSGVALEMKKLLPDSRIVAAMNGPAGDIIGQQIDRPVEIFLAGDDANAIETVSELMRGAGLIPVKTGQLSPSSIFNNQSLQKELK